MNVFVTESNVDRYLAQVRECSDLNQRDVLLRLVVEEEARMGHRREHMDNNQRRLTECKDRLARQHGVLSHMGPDHPARANAEHLLETLKQIIQIVESHQRLLQARFESSRL
jgi:hypothetical protein